MADSSLFIGKAFPSSDTFQRKQLSSSLASRRRWIGFIRTSRRSKSFGGKADAPFAGAQVTKIRADLRFRRTGRSEVEARKEVSVASYDLMSGRKQNWRSYRADAALVSP